MLIAGAYVADLARARTNAAATWENTAWLWMVAFVLWFRVWDDSI